MEREKEYASKGTATTGAVLGGVGTGAGLLALATQAIEYINNGRRDRAVEVAATAGITIADLIALYNTHNPNTPCTPTCSDDTPLTRYDGKQIELIASKDARIAELEADAKTDSKIVDLNNSVTNRFALRDEKLQEKFDKLADESKANAIESAKNEVRFECLAKQVEVNTYNIKGNSEAISQQAVYNGVNNEKVRCLQKQVNDLASDVDSFTEIVVPSKNVCNTGVNTAVYGALEQINSSIEALSGIVSAKK